jgi:hypothetical protein
VILPARKSQRPSDSAEVTTRTTPLTLLCVCLCICACVCLCLAAASCSPAGVGDTEGTVLVGDIVPSAQTVVDAFASSQPGGTPDHFENGETARQDGDFDVNSYFGVLTHLSVEPGWVLDYVYDYNGMGGRPVIYARLDEEPPFASYEEYEAAIATAAPGTGAGSSGPDYLAHVQADDTPESYFEWAVLRIMGSQFYLIWHANYNDTTVVCDNETLEEVFSATEASFGIGKLPSTVRRQAAKIDLSPTVHLPADGTATVRLVTFSKWGGLKEIHFTVGREFPHSTVDWAVETLVEYDCGVMF